MKPAVKIEEKPTPKVSDIFEKIRVARKMDKKQFAEFIGVSASSLSSNLGKEWDSHWRVFFKLVPDLTALDVITERDLQTPVPYEPLTNSRSVKTVKATSNSRK